MKQSGNHLILFAKYPEAGKVKTRLANDIGDEKAVEIYKTMVSRLLQNTISKNYHVSVFFSPENKFTEVKNWINLKNVNYLPQLGGDLGYRMLNAFNSSSTHNYDKTIIIGTDCLDINSDLITESFGLLDDNDLVLGPATDGGYYLIGLNKPVEPLFQDIPWSTDKVLKQSLNIASKLNIKHKLLDFRNDIDTLEDLTSHKYLMT